MLKIIFGSSRQISHNVMRWLTHSYFHVFPAYLILLELFLQQFTGGHFYTYR